MLSTTIINANAKRFNQTSPPPIYHIHSVLLRSSYYWANHIWLVLYLNMLLSVQLFNFNFKILSSIKNVCGSTGCMWLIECDDIMVDSPTGGCPSSRWLSWVSGILVRSVSFDFCLVIVEFPPAPSLSCPVAHRGRAEARPARPEVSPPPQFRLS